jgi:nickel-dependent lactate racemase
VLEIDELRRVFSLKITLKIPYGDGEKSFQVEDRNLLFNFVPRLPARPSRIQEAEAVRDALHNPIGSNSIESHVSGGDKVVLLVDDWTRPTPAYKVVPIVIEELLNSGVKAEDIRIIVSCGNHSPMDRLQIEEKLGRDIVARFQVQNHNPVGDLADLGESQKGTPVLVNKVFMEADFKVAVGGILAHPVAGYGGGAKIIVPGVASERTINHNHSLADSPNVAIGKAEGNPVREDMEDIARMAGLDFIVNVILNPEKEIICTVAGDFVKAHREGIRRYNQFYGMKVGQLADIIVLGAHPRDATIYHGTFTIPCAVPLLKEGRPIIWVATCLAGAGSRSGRERFRRILSVPPDQLMRSIKSGEVGASVGVFNWCTSKVVHRNKVVLVSDVVSRTEAEEFGFHYGESIQKALDEELSRTEDASVGVISVGGLAVPIQ